MKKKIVIISTSLFVILLVSAYSLYTTFAINSNLTSSDDNTYNFTLNNMENRSVTIPPNSSKIIIYKLYNSNNGTIKYELGYNKLENVIVMEYPGSQDPSSGTISLRETKFIKLKIINNNNNNITIILSALLGYEYGGDIIIPGGINVVNKNGNKASTYITSLYSNDSKDIITNDDINYNYAKNVSLMNDRLGGVSELNEGNIRYYGANPNNYIYFNCDDYSNQNANNCELWRIIGVFDDKLKIIRSTDIGSFSWDYNLDNSNDSNITWPTAKINDLLNNSYYNNEDTTYYNCPNGNDCNTVNVNFKSDNIGLKNQTTRDLIVNNTWNIDTNSKSNIASENYTNEQNGSKITGKIALLYPSDYLYSADTNYCDLSLINSWNENCIDNNYLSYDIKKGKSYWGLSSLKGESIGNFFYNYIDGNLHIGYDTETFHNNYIIPSLYLDPQVIISSSSGTNSDPYQIIF